MTAMGHWQLLVLDGSIRRQPLLGLEVGNRAIHEETEYTLEVWMNRGHLPSLTRESTQESIGHKKSLARIPMIATDGFRMGFSTTKEISVLQPAKVRIGEVTSLNLFTVTRVQVRLYVSMSLCLLT